MSIRLSFAAALLASNSPDGEAYDEHAHQDQQHTQQYDSSRVIRHY